MKLLRFLSLIWLSCGIKFLNPFVVVNGFNVRYDVGSTNIGRTLYSTKQNGAIHQYNPLEKNEVDDKYDVSNLAITDSNRRVNTRVRDIMKTITDWYKNKCRNTISSPRNHTESECDDRNSSGNDEEVLFSIESNIEEERPKPKDWKKTRNYLYGATSLTNDQVVDVLSFLDDVFSDDPELVVSIIRSSPRILRKNVESSLVPTVDFLKQLYGSKLFMVAVNRNPDLLLSTGVGYVTENGVSPVESFLVNSMQMEPNNLAKLKKTAPWIFQLPLVKVKSHCNFWKNLLKKENYDAGTTSSIIFDREEVDEGEDCRVYGSNNADTTHIVNSITKLMRTHPALFNLSVEKNLKPRVQYLSARLCLNYEDISTLILGSRANIFSLSVKHNLEPTIDYLLGILPSSSMAKQKDMVDNKNDNNKNEEIIERNNNIAFVRKCVLTHPQILGLSLQNLKSKILYFNAIDKLSSSCRDSSNDEALPIEPLSPKKSLPSRIMIRAPAVFSLSLKNNIIPKIEFLAGVWGTEKPQVTWTNSSCAEDESLSIVERFCSENDNNDTITTIRKPKRTNGATTSNSNNSIAATTTEACCSKSLASLLGEYPSILTLSLEGNIQPTVNFYNRTGHIELDCSWKLRPLKHDNDYMKTNSGKKKPVKKTIRGRYIAASLFNRLLPRWHYVLSIQKNGSSKIQMNNAGRRSGYLPWPALHVLVVKSDDEFCDYFGIIDEEYKQFKIESVPRLKFSSQFDTWLKTGRPIDT